ncbi:Bystin-domain-containing protein [Piedraia hortae CBS 480.64]|uniref:Bystin-domain-containing protein n=1 Tax=Piedraia hortae CBS 480.64 TaxID=1314780 RepID=A0A6A7BZQ3_9PEZI|nr:Bystin-domain-containing protein [Piedraia hortae CBS 480.64]
MSKAPRSRSSAAQNGQHKPLAEVYSPTEPFKQKAGKKRKSVDVEDKNDGYVGSKASRRILDLGQELVAEDEAPRMVQQPKHPASLFTFESRFPDQSNRSDDDEEDKVEDGVGLEDIDDEGSWGDVEDEAEEIDPNDLEMFNNFNPAKHAPPRSLLGQDDAADAAEAQGGINLADLILEKIAAHEAQPQQSQGPGEGGQRGNDGEEAIEFPPRVIEVYTQVGLHLSRYKSGKLPKPFKIIHTLPRWDILLEMTQPDRWSPNAVYEATKIFVSSEPAIARAFMSTVLLPRVRGDIAETKKLNPHLYKALKKALYKPAAFFDGLVLPLVASGTCTLREATIVGSVISRVSIPVMKSAMALYKLCKLSEEQMRQSVESAGACNTLIRILLEKKYALPTTVIDELVAYFLRFRLLDSDNVSMAGADNQTSMKLPVLWHRSLLAFAQRYKYVISEDQREALLDLLLQLGHYKVGPEVRRELIEGRDKAALVGANKDDGDDTMMMV